MKLTLDKDWFIRREALEENFDVAAGLPARHPSLDEAPAASRLTEEEQRAVDRSVMLLSKKK